jgi:hypothetical protein
MSTQTPSCFNFSRRSDFGFEVLPVTDCENTVTVVEGHPGLASIEELPNEDVGVDLARDISSPLVEWYCPSIQMT